MPRILVIADDFTGAAEIGGIAHLYGLSVKIGDVLPTQFSDDVMVIDSFSRNLRPQQAAKRIHDLLRGHDLNAYDYIYKKVDSVLRGPVESEIKAIMSLCRKERAILLPANPSKERIIQGGHYYIDGIPIHRTEFSRDPEYPRFSSAVRDMIVDATDILTPGIRDTAARGPAIYVPDAYSEETVNEVVTDYLDDSCLAAGGADFFSAILSHKFKLREILKQDYTTAGGNLHFVIGTRSDTSIRTLESLKNLGYACFYLPVNRDNENNVSEFEIGWLTAMQNNLSLALARPDQKLSGKDDSQDILELLTTAAVRLLEYCSPGDEICIEGGETASTILRHLKGHSLKIAEVPAGGVVKLELNTSGTYIIVKPGSYAWPDKILQHE